jgi:carboxyl-terminal processing protease
MVDGTSASASEIFAAAIQDYKRGIIIGSSSTYGKGTVQRSIPLSSSADILQLGSNKEEDLGNVKLTLQKFYRVNGGATQLRGVTPDIVLPDRFDYLKFREKDNPSALPWDEIAVADYQTWQNDPSMESVIKSEKEEAQKSPVFNNIKSNVQWLEKYMNKDYPLQIAKYREDQKQLKAVSKKMEELNKLSEPMSFSVPSADTSNINSSDEKIEKNKQWIKFRNTDVYIDESVKTLNKVIYQKNMAKADTLKP